MFGEKIPSFPGAEGFGRYATGGRGGDVYYVSTLDDSNDEGTLRYAISQSGPRTIVFNVSGTIFLKKDLRIENGDVTIAGQTAPGEGICIAGYPVTINSDNIIIRFIRFRVGNESGGDPDGLEGRGNKNLIIDHCSISWSVDECCSIYGGENTTVQWCLISESLRTAGHSKGKHGFGAIWGGSRASFHHNLLAHHESRVPRLGPHPSTQDREYVDMRNNVFYNWAGQGCYGGEGMHVNIVNNYYKPGPSTPKNNKISYRIAAIGVRTTEYCTDRNGKPNVWKPMEHVWGKFFVDGNLVEGHEDVSNDNWTKGIYEQINNDYCDNTFNDSIKKVMRLDHPLETDIITTHSAYDAYSFVLEYAGCSKERDPIDSRIVQEAKDGTATYFGSISKDADKYIGFIDSPIDVGGWPELKQGQILISTSKDGIPDVWKIEKGLEINKNVSNDYDLSSIYTNLEVYINSLVEEITTGQKLDNHKKIF